MSKMENMPVCDLRNFSSLAAVKNIEAITNVALVVFPKDASEEILQALQSVPMQNVASTIFLAKNDRIRIVDGISEICDADLSTTEDTALIINGIAVIGNLSPEARGTVYVNGIVVANSRLKSHPNFSFAMTNGIKLYADFDQYKMYPNKIEVDRDFLTWLPAGTAIIAGNKIILKSDVTIELLQEKMTRLVAGNKILCPNVLLGYVKTIAIVGNKIEGEDPHEDDDGR
jgi:hypothetical protein